MIDWSNLIMQAGGRAAVASSNIRFRFSEKPDGNLKYVSKAAYKYASAHWAWRELMARTASEVGQLFPKYRRQIEKEIRKSVQVQQQYNQKWIINNARLIPVKTGQITLDDGKTVVQAKDAWGRVVPEALFISYKGTDPIHTTIQSNTEGLREFTTNTVYFYDVNPQITVQSNKNIIQTQVQGRDYSRKELVSGGDLEFTISGNIVSHLAALETFDDHTESVVKYPENDVRKFIQIMQHPGIIDVNHYLFQQFNVERVIIKDFSFDQAEYKNMQPYRFTCVAVEPDEDVIIKQDTIDAFNREIAESPMNSWYQLVLDSKLVEMAGNAATELVKEAATVGLDALSFGATI